MVAVPKFARAPPQPYCELLALNVTPVMCNSLANFSSVNPLKIPPPWLLEVLKAMLVSPIVKMPPLPMAPLRRPHSSRQSQLPSAQTGFLKSPRHRYYQRRRRCPPRCSRETCNR